MREAHGSLYRRLCLRGHLDRGHGVRLRRVLSLGGSRAELGKELSLEEKPGETRGVTAEDDVGPSARHVRRDGDRVGAASLSDDLRLFRRELGPRVEELVGHALHQTAVLGLPPVLGQELGEVLAVLHGRGTHQHGPSFPVARHDEVRDRVPSSRGGSEHGVGLVRSFIFPVRRDGHHGEPVRGVQLLSLRGRGAGHA